MWIPDKFSILITLGISAIVLEILLGVATGFDLLLIGIVLVVSGLIGSLIQSFTLSLGMIIIISFIYIFFGRRLIKNKLSIETKTTNIDSIVGKQGIVIKKIEDNRAGQVKIESEVWRAQSTKNFDPGAKVNVKSVSGVTLTVE